MNPSTLLASSWMMILAVAAGTAVSGASLQFANAEPPAFRRARTLTVLSVVVDDGTPLWAPAQLPDGRALLALFAKAQPSGADGASDLAATPRSIQLIIELDGREQIIVNLPLPVASESQPYRFIAYAPLTNRVGTPVFTLTPGDAGELAAIVKVLLSQKPQ